MPKAKANLPVNPQARLIRRMIKTIWYLGRSPVPRVDARLWAEFYEQKARRLGVLPRKAGK